MAEQNTQEPIIFLDNISVTFKTRTGSILHPNLVHAVNGLRPPDTSTSRART